MSKPYEGLAEVINNTPSWNTGHMWAGEGGSFPMPGKDLYWTKPLDSHPWESDLKELSKLLTSQTDIPHGRLIRTTDELGITWETDCNSCRKAWQMKMDYILSKEAQPGKIVVL